MGNAYIGREALRTAQQTRDNRTVSHGDINVLAQDIKMWHASCVCVWKRIWGRETGGII